MSKRLQVVLDERELLEIQRVAEAQRMTVAEWVRQALRRERVRQPVSDAGRKLQCVREAATRSYPTGDVDSMLREIERGRASAGDA